MKFRSKILRQILAALVVLSEYYDDKVTFQRINEKKQKTNKNS
jgi:hypothetical protein